MTPVPQIDPNQHRKRSALRFIGPLVLAAGLGFLIVALVDFIRAVSNMNSGPPNLFWCGFIGLPLVWLGFVLTSAGFLGAVQRYVAGESAPVAKDTFNYLADGTKDGVKTVATAVGQGLSAGLHAPGAAGVRCHKCNATNPAASKFCSACGTALAKSKPCPACSELNDPDARFCDTCGKPLH